MKLNSLSEFIHHDIGNKYLLSPAPIRGIFKGNRGGGTAYEIYDFTLRALEIHPVKERNFLQAPVRFISKCKPINPDDEENPQYVEFKKLFPPENIIKDVNNRSSQVILRRPSGQILKAEFFSNQQKLDASKGVERSTIYQDEEIDKTFWDENQMRLLTSASKGYGGDSSVSVTPVEGISWMYDLIYMKASKTYRSKTIAENEYLKKKGYNLPEYEERNNGSGIEVFQWATDDNPIMSQPAMRTIFSNLYNIDMENISETDEDEYIMRRFGIFKAISGRMYRELDPSIHIISFKKYFNEELFSRYWNYRIVDYHQHKPWYISWIAISPQNEWFVWNELKARATTEEIREIIKEKSLVPEDDDMNRKTLFDPLSKSPQSNSGLSMFEYIKQGEKGLRRCEIADTKNSQARNNVIARLKNSIICKVPWNNKLNEDRKVINMNFRFGNNIPTLWIFDRCVGHIEHFRNWRARDWKTESAREDKDEKKILQKYSDYCRNLEFLGALNPVFYQEKSSSYEPRRFFQRSR